MNTIADTRQIIINQLWQTYVNSVMYVKQICALFNNNIKLDHFAIIDLPGSCSGIPFLKQIFTLLGFVEAGSGYLPEKQNDFIWLREEQCEDKIAQDVLPQIVIADFRLYELPLTVRNVIDKYVKYLNPLPLADMSHYIKTINNGDNLAQQSLITTVLNQFNTQKWPIPTLKDYQTVKEANELMAWVLVFGRQPNHFGLSIHYLSQFNNLKQFNQCLKNELNTPFNTCGSEIKGNPQLGIEQSSTADHLISIKLEDGILEIPSPFVEFVWRFPKVNNQKPIYWKDYYSDFYAPNANRVIESVFQSD